MHYRNDRVTNLVICGLAILGAPAVLWAEAGSPAPEKLPEGAQVVSLVAQPATISLAHKYDYAQLLVTARLASGDSLDVTRLAEVNAPASVCFSCSCDST